jgi:hypothetical protein
MIYIVETKTIWHFIIFQMEFIYLQNPPCPYLLITLVILKEHDTILVTAMMVLEELLMTALSLEKLKMKEPLILD